MLDEAVSLAICAAAMDVTLAGPAGSNIIASFDVRRIRDGGIDAPLLIDKADKNLESRM